LLPHRCFPSGVADIRGLGLLSCIPLANVLVSEYNEAEQQDGQSGD
jgi:hypothetical protein